MTDSTIERARVEAGLKGKFEVLSKNYHGLERRAHPRVERSLSLPDGLPDQDPLVAERCKRIAAEHQALWYKSKLSEIEEKSALTQEEFTGVTQEVKDGKKYVYKVKLFKIGEDSKGLSVAGESMADVISTVSAVDYLSGWEIIAISRGSVIDIL